MGVNREASIVLLQAEYHWAYTKCFEHSQQASKVNSMEPLIEEAISCPYCGEQIRVLIDCSVEEQEYIEDCEVCCRPITFQVWVPREGEPQVVVSAEND